MQYEVFNGTLKSSLWFMDNYNTYTFWADDIAPLKHEPYSTGSSDIATKLVMATIPDWPTKSRWFFKANEGQFEADDAIKAKVHELTDALPDEEGQDPGLFALGGGQRPVLRDQPWAVRGLHAAQGDGDVPRSRRGVQGQGGHAGDDAARAGARGVSIADDGRHSCGRDPGGSIQSHGYGPCATRMGVSGFSIRRGPR